MRDLTRISPIDEFAGQFGHSRDAMSVARIQPPPLTFRYVMQRAAIQFSSPLARGPGSQRCLAFEGLVVQNDSAASNQLRLINSRIESKFTADNDQVNSLATIEIHIKPKHLSLLVHSGARAGLGSCLKIALIAAARFGSKGNGTMAVLCSGMPVNRVGTTGTPTFAKSCTVVQLICPFG